MFIIYIFYRWFNDMVFYIKKWLIKCYGNDYELKEKESKIYDYLLLFIFYYFYYLFF